jgi:hypothetical protein
MVMLVAKKKNIIRDQGGMVYLTALAIMAILMSFGLAFLYAAQTEMKISSNEMQGLRCFYLAEGGVEHAMGKLLYGGVHYTGPGTFFVVDYTDMSPSTTYIAFMPDAKTIVGRGQTAGSFAKEIKVKINESGFSSAMMLAGNSFTFISTPSPQGVINGNVEAATASGTIESRLAGVSVVGRAKYGTVSIPAVSFLATNPYKTAAIAAGTYYNPSQQWSASTNTGTDPAAIHYIDGSLYLIGPGPITITGTVVVNGDLVIGQRKPPPTIYAPITNSTITFNPAPGKPAVVVNGIISNTSFLTNTDLTFNGMVYANKYVNIQHFNKLTINGALVALGTPIGNAIQYGSLIYINYDPSFDPGTGYFTGGKVGIPAIVSWEGHYSAYAQH